MTRPEDKDAVLNCRRAMRALYAEAPAPVARDVASRVEAALAQAWQEGYDARSPGESNPYANVTSEVQQ